MNFVALACRTAVVVVLAAAVGGKVVGHRRWSLFRDTVGRAVPFRPTGAVAAAVIVAEIAVMILIAVDRTAAWGLAAAAVMFTAFTGVLLRLRRRRLPCACFGSGPTPAGGYEVTRNALLIVMCGTGLTAVPSPYAAADPGSVIAGVSLACLVTLGGQFRLLFRPARPLLRR